MAFRGMRTFLSSSRLHLNVFDSVSVFSVSVSLSVSVALTLLLSPSPSFFCPPPYLPSFGYPIFSPEYLSPVPPPYPLPLPLSPRPLPLLHPLPSLPPVYQYRGSFLLEEIIKKNFLTLQKRREISVRCGGGRRGGGGGVKRREER